MSAGPRDRRGRPFDPSGLLVGYWMWAASRFGCSRVGIRWTPPAPGKPDHARFTRRSRGGSPGGCEVCPRLPSRRRVRWFTLRHMRRPLATAIASPTRRCRSRHRRAHAGPAAADARDTWARPGSLRPSEPPRPRRQPRRRGPVKPNGADKQHILVLPLPASHAVDLERRARKFDARLLVADSMTRGASRPVTPDVEPECTSASCLAATRRGGPRTRRSAC